MVRFNPFNTGVQRLLAYLAEVTTVSQVYHKPIGVITIDFIAALERKERLDPIFAVVVKATTEVEP